MNINLHKPLQGVIGKNPNAETISAGNIFNKATTNAFANRGSPSQVLQKSQENDKNMNNVNNLNALWGTNKTNDQNKNQIPSPIGQPTYNSQYPNPNNLQKISNVTQNRNLANQANRPQNGTQNTQNVIQGKISNMANNIGGPQGTIDNNNLSDSRSSLTGVKIQTLSERLVKLRSNNIQKVQTIDNTLKAYTNLQKIGQNTNIYPSPQPNIAYENRPTNPIKPSFQTESSRYISFMKETNPSINNLDILLNYVFKYLIEHVNPMNVPQNLQTFINELLYYSSNLKNYLNAQKYKQLKHYNYSKEQQQKIIKYLNQYHQLKSLLQGFQYSIQKNLQSNPNYQNSNYLSFASDIYFYLIKMYEHRRNELYSIFHHKLDDLGQFNQIIENKQKQIMNRWNNNEFDESIKYSNSIYPIYPIQISGQSLAIEMGSQYTNINQLLNTNNNYTKQMINNQLMQLQLLKNELNRLQLRKQIQSQQHLWYQKRNNYDVGQIDDFIYKNKKIRYNQDVQTNCIIIKFQPSQSFQEKKKDKSIISSSISSISKLSNKSLRTSNKMIKLYNLIKFTIVISLEHCKEEMIFKVIEGSLQVKVGSQKKHYLQKAQQYLQKYVQAHYSKLLLKDYHVRSQSQGKIKQSDENTIKITFTNHLKLKDNYFLTFDEIIQENSLSLKGLVIKNSFGMIQWHDVISIYDIDFIEHLIIEDNSFSCQHSCLNSSCQVTFFNFPYFITKNKVTLNNPDLLCQKLTKKIEKGHQKIIKIDYQKQHYKIHFDCFFQGDELILLKEEQKKREDDRQIQKDSRLIQLDQILLNDRIISFKIIGQPSSIEQLQLSKIQSAQSIFQDGVLPFLPKQIKKQ